MKTKKLLLTCLIVIHTIASVEAQGTFQNLGFESASLVVIPEDPYGSVQFDNAFPGWVGFVGGVQQSRALYNNYFLDSSGISIIDNNWPDYFGPTAGVISGNYTALLQAGLSLSITPTPADTTLSQTSLVPVSAESLQFRAYSPSGFGLPKVVLGGQQLSLVPLASGTNYIVYGADIHAWQGQMAQLDFTLVAQRPHRVNSYLFLDRIQFSAEPIPEPRALCLIGFGALFLGWRLRKL